MLVQSNWEKSLFELNIASLCTLCVYVWNNPFELQWTRDIVSVSGPSLILSVYTVFFTFCACMNVVITPWLLQKQHESRCTGEVWQVKGNSACAFGRMCRQDWRCFGLFFSASLMYVISDSTWRQHSTYCGCKLRSLLTIWKMITPGISNINKLHWQ